MTNTVDENRPYCRALYDFRSEYPNELDFSAGDLLFISGQINAEWFCGERQSDGRKGIFPVGFAEVVVPLADKPAGLQISEIGTTSGKTSTGKALHEDDQLISSISMASVLYDFEPRYQDEISVKAGDSVEVLALVDCEWAKCRDPISGRVGIVPQSFLHIFLDQTDSNDTAPANDSAFSTPSSLTPVAFTDPLLHDSHSLYTSSKTLHPPLPKSIFTPTQTSTATNKGFFDPWELEQPNPFASATMPRKASAPNLIAPPPRPPPPKMSAHETPMATARPHSMVMPGQMSTIATKSLSIFSTGKKSTATTTKPFHGKTHSSEHARAEAHANWNGAGVEEAVEADESLISGISTTTNTTTATANQFQLNTSSAAQSNTKSKVLLDLLNTERTYLFDLETWEACIQESGELNAEDKRALTSGYPILKQLSQLLIDALNIQKDLPVGEQTLGEVFMTLKEQFFTAFANHFRTVEQISAIVESDEPTAEMDAGGKQQTTTTTNGTLQRALQGCVHAMRTRGSNVFDVPTAVSRPIQRCLKYPLYLGELLKNTPINHPDHPKLMEALRQLGNLATKMNECKRRKELVRKYKCQEQLSLADRLARINMHSLVKKSNRLKFRINRTMGFGTVKDSEFDYLVQLLDESERRLCKFLYCAQLYRKHVEMAVKRHEDSYKGACQVQDEQMVKAFAHMFRRVDEICRAHIRTFEQDVINEGKRLVRSELTKLIHKRYDKLADFEAAKAVTANSSSNTASTGNTAAGGAATKNPDELLEMRRNEFEALNNQIKVQLPRVISGINKRVLQLVQRVNELHTAFLRQMDDWYERERPEKVRHCAPMAQSFTAHLSASLKHTLVEMDKIAAYLYQRQANGESGGGQTASGSLAIARKKSLRLSLKSSSSKFGGHKKQSQQRRAQNAKERDALIKICQAQNQWDRLRRVCRDWQSVDMMLRTGDVLWVRAHRQDGFCLCDNAVATGLVPLELLSPMDPMLLENTINSPNGATTVGETSMTSTPASSASVIATPQQSQLSWIEQLGVVGSSTGFNTTNAPFSSTHAQPVSASGNANVAHSQKKKTDDLIDLGDNLIDLYSPPKSNGTSTAIGGGNGTAVSNISTLKPQQQQPPAPHRQMDDPFDELFLLAAVSSASASNASVRQAVSPPTVPEIPERPSTAASSIEDTLWNMPTPQITTPVFERKPQQQQQQQLPPPSYQAALLAIQAKQNNGSRGIQPIRIAPPPPSQKKRATHYQQFNLQTQQSQLLYAIPPTTHSDWPAAPPNVQNPGTEYPTTNAYYSMPPPTGKSNSMAYYSLPPSAVESSTQQQQRKQ